MAMEFAKTAARLALMTPAWPLSTWLGRFFRSATYLRKREASLKLFWYVAVGSAFGGVARFALGGFIQQRAGPGFPVGTLIINITGSFLLGMLMRYSLQSDFVSPEVRIMLTTGFCGGYTTFSTFAYETAGLMEDGAYGRAALYVTASVVAGVLGMFLGFAVANQLIAVRAQS